jgi:cell division protein FtsL
MPLFAKLATLAAALFLVIGFGRITLDSTTSALAMEASDVSAQIELVRDGSNSLEVEQSTLSNPTRIKEEASKLGMVTPESTTFIDISGDVVVTDEAGRLSLSGSVEALS